MNTVIIGAGLAGLSTALKLKKNFIILEKEARPGGLCRTEIIKDFVFDYTGHLLHLRDKNIEDFILKNIKSRLNKIQRKSFVFSFNTFTKYPYQINNYGLPEKIIEENLIGFIRAMKQKEKNKKNFKAWVISNFGTGIAKNFMLPYNEKLWKYPLDKLTINWMGRFVPSTSLEDILKGILPDKEIITGYNAFFYYPEKGGIETIVKGLYEKVKDKVKLNTKVDAIDLKKKIIYFNRVSIKYDNLVVTMSLREFLKILDKDMTKVYKKLKATSVYALNIGFKTREKIEKNWIYIPEKKFSFYRVGFPHTFSIYNTPEGYSSLYAEVSFKKEIPKDINENIIKDLIKMDIIKNKKDIKIIYPMVLKDAYVIYDKQRDEIVNHIKEQLKKQNVYLAGRWANWEYSSMEDAIKEGFEVADFINKNG